MDSDTIAAVATPFGYGGVGVIKISGPDAIPFADRLFRRKSKTRGQPSEASQAVSPSEFAPRRLYHGYISDPDSGHTVDEVLMAIMPGPHSYTREDVVEIQSHSGYVVLSGIMALLFKQGARHAEPGEFTRRAFLNGRIDLAQAEAVMDVIHARTAQFLNVVQRHAEGAFSRKIHAIRESILALLADINADIEFSEDDDIDIDYHQLEHLLSDVVLSPLKELLQQFDAGAVFRKGIKVAVIGRPNVGKSSLINRLIQKDRMIVTEVPGTTRDIVEEQIEIHGVPVTFADTAGLHLTDDIVEIIGIRKAREYVSSADVVLLVIDAGESADIEDTQRLLSEINKPAIIVVNKVDLHDHNVACIIDQMRAYPSVKTSALQNQGIEDVKIKIQALLVQPLLKAPLDLAPNLRQKQLIQNAVDDLNRGMNGMASNAPVELIAFDIQNALKHLADIFGRTCSDDILDRIFSQFCIGK